MKTFRASVMVGLFGLFGALTACGGEARADTNTAASAVDGERGGPRGAHRPGGPDGLLMAALHAPINLTPAQKSTIEAALEEARPKAPPAKNRAALAAAVRAANIDPAALKGAVPSAADDGQRTAAMAKAIGTLHATLTKEQRIALIEAMTQRMKDKGGKDGPEGHGPPPDGKEGGHGHGHGPMGFMLEGLDLTQAQKDALRAAHEENRPPKPTEAQKEEMKKQHEARRAEMQARLRTFAGDSFDATAFVTPPADAKGGPDHGDRMLKDLAILVSVLDSAQREKLAARIEQGPPEHGHRK